MKDFTKYSTEELIRMSEVAFSEYYRLAIRPAVNPSPADLAPLKHATAKYEAICEEIEKRLVQG